MLTAQCFPPLLDKIAIRKITVCLPADSAGPKQNYISATFQSVSHVRMKEVPRRNRALIRQGRQRKITLLDQALLVTVSARMNQGTQGLPTKTSTSSGREGGREPSHFFQSVNSNRVASHYCDAKVGGARLYSPVCGVPDALASLGRQHFPRCHSRDRDEPPIKPAIDSDNASGLLLAGVTVAPRAADRRVALLGEPASHIREVATMQPSAFAEPEEPENSRWRM
jgi:hypothetical protein